MVQVLAPRGGPTGLLITLAKWGLTIIDVVSGAGAITKYTVGPAWTGAEFATVQGAVDAADLAGLQPARIEIYPGTYPDPVVIPATLRQWHLVATGAQADGVEITGPFTANLPDSDGGFSCREIRFVGVTTFVQAAPVGTCNGIFNACRWQTGGFTINAPRYLIEFKNTCTFSGVQNWILRSLYCEGARFLNGVTTECDVASGANQIENCYFQGVGPSSPIRFRGRSGGLNHCTVYCSGAGSVIDETISFIEYTNTTFSRNVGPAGPLVVQTGTASQTDGGNSFVDGALYPFFQVATPAQRPNRGQTDDELRRVLHVSGSPTLTPAQIGSQRKTTVIKDDNGGGVALPALATVEPGCTVAFKDGSLNSSASPWFIVPDGAETIDAAVNYQISIDGQAVELQADQVASRWIVKGAYL